MTAENLNRDRSGQDPNSEADAWQKMADEARSGNDPNLDQPDNESSSKDENLFVDRINAPIADSKETLPQSEVLRAKIAQDEQALEQLEKGVQEIQNMLQAERAKDDDEKAVHDRLSTAVLSKRTQIGVTESYLERAQDELKNENREQLYDDIERKEGAMDDAEQRLAAVKQERDALVQEDNHDGGKDDGQNPDDDEKFFFAAINVDMEDELRKEAHRLADEAVDAEVAQKGFLTKLWKGNLFNKLYKERYAQQLMRGEQTVEMDGQQVSLSEKLKTERGQAHLDRMIGAIVDSATFMHENETMTVNETETSCVKDAIRDYYQGLQSGADPKQLEHAFEEAVSFNRAKARDDGEALDDVTANNYLEVAKNAIKKVNHEVSLDRVLEGFYVYDAKVTDAVHSSEHNNTIDNIIEKLEGKSGFGMVAAQAAAAAVGIASAFSNAGARALGGVGLGIAASGALAGGKAYHKATVDRATMMRNAAVNREYSGTSEHPEEFDNRRAAKTAKYEAKIGGTVYEMVSARDLTNDLNEALNSGDHDAILRATAAVQARIDFSENADKDLISYSSADSVGKEDLEMRKSLFMAKDYLDQQENGQAELKLMQEEITKSILEDVENKDAEFSSARRRVAAKAAAKSIAIGAGSFFASQEIGALLNPNQIGLLEKFNLVQTQNNVDAQQTVLTELFTGPRTYVDHSTIVSGDDVATRNRLKAEGYTETEVQPATTSTREVVRDVPIDQANGRVNVHTVYANNGTTISDGNELKIMGDGSHGLFNNMNQISTMPDGSQINAPRIASSGALRGLMNINGQQFIVMPKGNAFIDENGFAQLVDIHDNPIGTIQVGANFNTMSGGFFNDNGDFVSLATQVNHNSFFGTIKQTITEAFTNPAQYQLDHVVQAGMNTQGIFIPTTPVDSLGTTRQRPTPPEPTPLNPESDDNSDSEQPDQPQPTPPNPTGPTSPDSREPIGELPPAPSAADLEPIAELPPADTDLNPIGELPPAPNEQPNSPLNQGASPDLTPIGELPPAPGEPSASPDNLEPIGELPPAPGELATPTADTTPAAAELPPAPNESAQPTTEVSPAETDNPNPSPEPQPAQTGEQSQTQLDRLRDSMILSPEERNLFNEIASYQNVIGRLGVIFLTNNYYNDSSHSDQYNQYAEWYDSLSDEGRAAVSSILERISSSGAKAYRGHGDTNMGREFAEWLRNRGPNANA